MGTVAGHGGVATRPAAGPPGAVAPFAWLMSAYEELLGAVKYVRDRTGDPNAWQTGLAPNEVAAVVTPTTPPEQLEAILRKIRQQHSEILGAGTPGGPLRTRPPAVAFAAPDREQGDAAEAIANAEAALAHQNSASSQLDMQVISAILNAHLKTVEGTEALTSLQRETEAAVHTRSDLDTPAGARDFQRFLIGKLRDIREVVLNASLDDTSKSALMAAWTSLYDASKSEPNGTTPPPTDDPDTEWDPLLDSLWPDDPGLSPGDVSEPGSTDATPAPAMAMPPMIPTIPSFGTGSLPGLGATPGSSGLPLSRLLGDNKTDPAAHELDDEGSQDPDPGAPASPDETTDHKSDADKDRDGDASADGGESTRPTGPTTVTLPDGETVTAASPQLAAAIKAAVGGAPIADAFRQQGITIPAPGTPVTNPIDLPQLIPGDLGIFTDRHALALGPGKALLDGQIQHIATVSGPSFLGWEHPPAATATVTEPAKPSTPTPTRPAAPPTRGQ